ncbi:MAG TPA: DUF1028 domain-containing protein [Candidatus Marinimicrobia bacterium]|nr:DUF1028 domain-containing protein [Candidatus Neomarinimicrobiota bacterium]
MYRIFKTVIFFLLIPLTAQDTFSIVAVDTLTGEVGSAGASCISGSIIISDLHPGIGAIHTQAYWTATNQQNASNLMANGYSPDEIIEWLVENDVQNNPGIRQYGVVDLIDGGRSAAFTGENCSDYKNHITGDTYAIQGNILLGQEILDDMEIAFLSTFGTMDEKLLASLQAANVPGADTRCMDYGIPALSAFIRVAQPENTADSLYLHINVNSVLIVTSPIDSLYQLYWDWKRTKYILGDIDYNRLIDIRDILLLADFIEGYMSPTALQINPSDMNNNGEVEISDLYVLIYYLVGTVG